MSTAEGDLELIEQPPSAKVKPVAKWASEVEDDTGRGKERNSIPKKKPVFNFFRSPINILRNDWRALAAEFVATMMFVFMGTGLIVSYQKDQEEGGDLGAGLVSIALGFGIALSTMIYTVANISGGHLNPAVTIALLVIRQIELFKAFFYVCCQIIGAILGTLLMYWVMPDSTANAVHMGATLLATGVLPGQGVAIEIFLTFILVFTVCATAQLSGDLTSMGRFAPLAIGYSVLVDHMIGVPFTGASMNPARSFGPAVVDGTVWANHWVYWVGPIAGGILAAIVYHHVFILRDGEIERKE